VTAEEMAETAVSNICLVEEQADIVVMVAGELPIAGAILLRLRDQVAVAVAVQGHVLFIMLALAAV